MIFKFAVFCLLVFVSACNFKQIITTADNKDNFFEPRFFTTASRSNLKVGDDFVFLDMRVRRIVQLGVNPLELKNSVPLGLDTDKQWFFSSPDAEYFITIERSGYSIVKSDGSSNQDPVQLEEKIAGVAYSPSYHHLIIASDTGEAALLKLSSKGDVESSFQSEMDLEEDEGILAVVFLNDGSLLVAREENTLIIVDFDTTISDQSWSYRSFDLDASANYAAPKSMTWLSPIAANDDLVLIKDAERLIVVDIVNETILDEKDLSGKHIVKAFRKTSPHVIACDDFVDGKTAHKSYQLFWVGDNDSIEIKSFPVILSDFNDSWLSSDKSILVLSYNELNPKQTAMFKGWVYRYDVSNGWVIDKSEVQEDVRLGIEEDFLVLHFSSALGFVELRTYGSDPGVEKLEKFNLEGLKENYEDRN